MSSKRLMAATMSFLVASGSLTNVVSHAEQAILIPGAMPLKQINPWYPSVVASYPSIGVHFRGDDLWQLIDYSQNPLASDTALREGVNRAMAAIGGVEGGVAIIGESMGSMVAWRVAEELAAADPDRTDVRVVLIAPPETGVAEYFKEGTYIPILNYRITRIRESEYPTTVVIGEYDGWADPPDRPWNLISSANALLGTQIVHGPPIFTADPADGIATTDGNVTTVFVPTAKLPLTQVLRDVGVPDALVDKADEVLRPIVDAGYVRHDQPGDTRPYLRDGEIHRNVQSQQEARVTQKQQGGEKSPLPAAERRAHRTELRHAIRNDIRERVEAGLGQLKKAIAAVRPRPARGT
jgi:diacyltrehalose acyltransferase